MLKKKVKTLQKESVYRWEKLDLGKSKAAILKDRTHKNEQSFIWNIEEIKLR